MRWGGVNAELGQQADGADDFFENLVFCVICLPQALENFDFLILIKFDVLFR